MVHHEIVHFNEFKLSVNAPFEPEFWYSVPISAKKILKLPHHRQKMTFTVTFNIHEKTLKTTLTAV